MQIAPGPRVCYLSTWVGDYHAPRLKSLSDLLRGQGGQLHVVQFGDRSMFYSHAQKRRDGLLKELDFLQLPRAGRLSLARDVWRYLRRTKPEHIFVLGYNDPISLASALYARVHGARIYFLSDSKADDQPRAFVTELIKRFVLLAYDGALVAGRRHRAYFQSLGFPRMIEIGYDVVDNNYFLARAKAYRAKSSLMLRLGVLPERYVLCVSRLVARKCVQRALELFALSGIANKGVKFVLVGDGPERAVITERADALGVSPALVHVEQLANHRMPMLYSHAQALILTSDYDQWGLCVNEAMSCGVPAFVTYRCGVATEIVTEENGVIIDNDDIGAAAIELAKVVDDCSHRHRLSVRCEETMARWNLDRFAHGAMRLIESSANQ